MKRFEIGANGCHNQPMFGTGDGIAATQINGAFMDTKRGLALQQSVRPVPNEWP
jgi:hypothetical protein